MSYPTNAVLSAVDSALPAQTEAGSNLGPALRQTRAVYGRLLTILFDDADAIKRVIGSAQLIAGGVDSAALANLAVTAAKLADLAVTAGKLADSAVESAKLANLAVTTAKLADLCVTAAKLGAGAVETAKLADLAVTAAKLAADAVTTAKIANGAVTTDKLGSKAVTPEKMTGTAHATLPQVFVLDTSGNVSVLPLGGGVSAAISGGALVVTGSSTPLLTRPLTIIQETVNNVTPEKVPASLGAWGLRTTQNSTKRAFEKVFESTAGLITLPTTKNEFTIVTPGTYLIHGTLQSGGSVHSVDTSGAQLGVLHAQVELVKNPNSTPVSMYRSPIYSGDARSVVTGGNGVRWNNGFAIPVQTILIVTAANQTFGWQQYNQWSTQGGTPVAMTTSDYQPGFAHFTAQANVGSPAELPNQGGNTSTGILFIEKLV